MISVRLQDTFMFGRISMFYSCNTYFLELELMEQLESAIEVDARDVICLVLQYLHELGLTTSATTLSDETGE